MPLLSFCQRGATNLSHHGDYAPSDQPNILVLLFLWLKRLCQGFGYLKKTLRTVVAPYSVAMDVKDSLIDPKTGP